MWKRVDHEGIPLGDVSGVKGGEGGRKGRGGKGGEHEHAPTPRVFGNVNALKALRGLESL